MQLPTRRLRSNVLRGTQGGDSFVMPNSLRGFDPRTSRPPHDLVMSFARHLATQRLRWPHRGPRSLGSQETGS